MLVVHSKIPPNSLLFHGTIMLVVQSKIPSYSLLFHETIMLVVKSPLGSNRCAHIQLFTLSLQIFSSTMCQAHKLIAVLEMIKDTWSSKVIILTPYYTFCFLKRSVTNTLDIFCVRQGQKGNVLNTLMRNILLMSHITFKDRQRSRFYNPYFRKYTIQNKRKR